MQTWILDFICSIYQISGSLCLHKYISAVTRTRLQPRSLVSKAHIYRTSPVIQQIARFFLPVCLSRYHHFTRSLSLFYFFFFFFFLRGLPYPLAIQASDSRVMAAARAINTVCLVSFLAGCIKHWMAVADYSWDSFPYTCWVGEIQVNGGTLAAAQWEGQELGHFECFHVTLDE